MKEYRFIIWCSQTNLNIVNNSIIQKSLMLGYMYVKILLEINARL